MRVTILLLTVIASTIASTGACHLAADDGVPSWPQFRGVDARGIAEPGDYPSEFGPQQNLLWRVAIPTGVSSPCIWNDRIFLTSHNKDDNSLETICVQRADGSILWRKKVETDQIEQVHEVSSPANATPATDGKRVCVYFASCGLICYDFEGNELWNVSLPLVPSRFGSGTSPIMVDDMVILGRDGFRLSLGDKAPHIRAVSAETGETLWMTRRFQGVVNYATPVVWRSETGDQLLAIGSGLLTSYDLKTGKALWWVKNLPPQVCATPQVTDDRVFVTATGMFGEPETFVGVPDFAEVVKEHDKNQDGQIGLDELPDDINVIDRRASRGAGNSPISQFARGIDANRDKKIDEREWQRFNTGFGDFIRSAVPGVYSIRMGGEGDVTQSNIDWHAEKGVAEVPSLLILPDRAFLVRNGGIVHCRSLTDGKDLYRGRLGPGGGYYASPVAAGNQVYFASDRGVVTVIEANSPKLNVLARNDLKEPIIATPALVDDKIYVRTENHLYAFGH